MAEPTPLPEGGQLSAAERALIAHGNITRIHARLTRIPQTLGVSWHGASAAVFTQVLDEWTPQFTRVIDALHTIAEDLRTPPVQHAEATGSREAAGGPGAALGGEL